MVLLALLGACSFEHGVAGEPANDAQPGDAATDGPAKVAQIEVGPVATTTVNYTTSGQLSYTVPANASLLLVSLSASYSGTTATAVRWGATNLTSVGSVDALSQDGRVEIWKLVAPQPGASQVSIAVSSASSAIVVGVVSFYGTHATTPHGVLVPATGVAGAPTITLPSAAGERAFGVVMWNGAYTTLAADAAQVSHWNMGSSNVTGAGSSKAGATTTTLSWAVTNDYNDSWAIGAISLQPSIE